MSTRIIRPPAFQKPSGMMYLVGDQLNLVDNQETLVELNTIRVDFNDAIENIVTHRITPGKSGFYSIVGQVRFKSVVADKSYHALIRRNTVAIVQNNAFHSSNALGLTAVCIVPNWYLEADDYIELYAVSNAGVDTVDIDGCELRTFLAVQRVR